MKVKEPKALLHTFDSIIYVVIRKNGTPGCWVRLQIGATKSCYRPSTNDTAVYCYIDKNFGWTDLEQAQKNLDQTAEHFNLADMEFT